jgi:surface carbohydrate biosynthesis protein
MPVPDQPHVCLIVDNPLRDLEGLVLLGRELATRGAKVTLVPMYEQGFDVPALQPDLVLLNYTRPNNADLIRRYKRAGILVGVLDTEGIGGNNADEFAKLVKNAGSPDLLDLYCVWGQAQRDAFLKHGTVPAHILHATGCPRYDFCAGPWRAALSKPSVGADYVLLNTNFPTVNPRFSKGPDDEVETIVNAGYSRDYANQVVIEARHAYQSMLKMSMKLAEHFPDVHFVLRPHPFENIKSYDALAAYPNFEVRQEGTSIEWINRARLLIHQNCSTAIEATMLNVEPLSMEWFNTPSLRVQAAAQVSRPVASETDLIALVKEGLESRLPSVAEETAQFRRQIISDLFTAVDGASSIRVADVVLDTIAKARGKVRSGAVPRPSLRGRAVAMARATLGYKATSALRRRFGSPEIERRRLAKSFAVDMVGAVLGRIDAASVDGRRFSVRRVVGDTRRMAGAVSGGSLQLTEAS